MVAVIQALVLPEDVWDKLPSKLVQLDLAKSLNYHLHITDLQRQKIIVQIQAEDHQSVEEGLKILNPLRDNLHLNLQKYLSKVSAWSPLQKQEEAFQFKDSTQLSMDQ